MQRKRDSLVVKQKRLKEILKLRTQMREKFLTVKTGDSEFASQLSKQQQSFLGEDFDSQRKTDDLIDQYIKASDVDKPIYYAQLPRHIQYEIKKAQLSSTSKNQGAPGVAPRLNQIELDLQQLITEVRNNTGANLQNAYQNLLAQINQTRIDVQGMPITDLTKTEKKLDELEKKLVDIHNQMNGVPKTPSRPSSPTGGKSSNPTKAKPYKGIIDKAVGTNKNSFIRSSTDKNGKSIVSYNARYYALIEDLEAGELVIYMLKDDSEILKKSGIAPGLIRLLTNDDVNISEVDIPSILEYNLLMDKIDPTMSKSSKKYEQYRKPHVYVTQVVKKNIDEVKNYIRLTIQPLLALTTLKKNETKYINILPYKHYKQLADHVTKLTALKASQEGAYVPPGEIDNLLTELNTIIIDYIDLLQKLRDHYVNTLGGNITKLSWIRQFQVAKVTGFGFRGSGMPSTKIYTTMDEMQNRLNLIIASKQAGNNSKEIEREIKFLQKHLI